MLMRQAALVLSPATLLVLVQCNCLQNLLGSQNLPEAVSTAVVLLNRMVRLMRD